MPNDQPDQQLALPSPLVLYDTDVYMQTAESQCDCACAAYHPRSRAVDGGFLSGMTLAQLAYPFVAVPMRGDCHAVLTGQTPGAVVLNDAALAMAQYFQQPRPLTELPDTWREQWGGEAVAAALTRMAQVGILTAVDQAELSLMDTSTTLVAWLHLTERCNLRCSYCYLSPGAQDMSLATGKAALEATFRSASARGYRQVKLKYAGGEPLLGFSKVVDLHHYARALAGQHDVELDGVVLSNGTQLNVLMVREMQALGLRLMISLDGLQPWHDRHRQHANGRGCFAEVLQAIDLALDHDLVPEISVTVSDATVAGLPDLVAWLLERDLPFGFNYYREPACSAGKSDLRLTEQTMIDSMLRAFDVIEQNLPRRSLLTSLVDHANLAAAHSYPCQAGRHYLVFDTQGRIARCQMEIDQAVDATGVADPLTLVQHETSSFGNPPFEAKQACSDCSWKYWCAGGCPLAAWRATGHFVSRSPYCRIYQALFPAALRLDGLRVLRNVMVQNAHPQAVDRTRQPQPPIPTGHTCIAIRGLS